MKLAYVGCRTTVQRNARGKGIKAFIIDEQGEWSLKQLVPGVVNPSFLCLDQNAQHLYTVHGDGSEISAYTVAPDGALSFLNTVPIDGVNPVHLTVDRTGRWLYVASHRSGTLCALAIKPDGELQGSAFSFTDPGKDEGGFSHPHQILLDRTGRYAIVPSQGLREGMGKIAVYWILPESGKFELTDVFYARKKAEPRHCAIHPNNRFLYCVNEWDYTITFLEFDATAGTLCPKQVVNTLPDTWIREGWASAIDIDFTGAFLYTTDRNYNTVMQFSISRETGRLTYVRDLPTHGKQPRFMTVEPESGHIFVANECSDTIFELNAAAEYAEDTVVRKIDAESPVCILFADKH